MENNYIKRLNDSDYDHLGVKLVNVLGLEIAEMNIKLEADNLLSVYAYGAGKCLAKILFEDCKMFECKTSPRLKLENPQDVEVAFVDYMIERFGQEYLDLYLMQNEDSLVLAN